MHACNYDRSAAYGAQWQEPELIFGRLLNMETCAREGKGVACASLRPAETFMRVYETHGNCMSPCKNAQTIVS